MSACFDMKRVIELRWKLLLLIWINYLPAILSTHIEIGTDGGYKKIVIAVSKRTLESNSDLNELQTKFKDFFSKVSDELFIATRNRAFLSEIQVLLPHVEDSTLADSNVDIKKSTFESFQQADIRFDTYNPVPERGDVYTHQPRGCGKRGDFIYLNPNSIDDKNYTHAKKFVQEWAKFRYGVFDESGDGSDAFPNNYINGNGKSETTGCTNDINTSFSSIMDTIHSQSNTFCDDIDHPHNKFAPNRQNAFCRTSSTWNVILKNNDFKNYTIVKPPNSAPKINFVKLVANVVIIIDPMVCITDENGKTIYDTRSHMLNLALRKFIQDSPSYVHIGFVVALNKPEIIHIQRKDISLITKLQEITNTNKNLLATTALRAGIDAANKMLSDVSGYGNLILITSTKQLKRVLPLTLPKPKSASFFLLTWTKNQDSSWTNENVEQLKNFVNYPTQYLWMDIVVKNSFSNCDVNSRLQIEDAFHQFFTKFLHDDFYSSKIKIKQYVMAKGIASSFRLPFTNASVFFNIYGCEYNHDEKLVSLTVNKKLLSNLMADDTLEKDIYFSYKWKNSVPENLEISFEAVVSNSTSLGSSVWIEVPIDIALLKASDVKLEREKGDNSPVILYSFTPSNVKVYVEITCDTKFNVMVELRDNGNGDPDAMANDKIFSRYFVNSHSNNVFAIKVIAKDSQGNIIDQRNLGSIAIKSQDITELPPNRIVDLYLKSVDFTSSSTVLSWTSPGQHYDNGTASAYYLKCVTNFNDLNLHILLLMDEKEKIDLIPNISGSKEEYTRNITKRETVYFCSIASKNEHRSSEWSNIVSVYVDKLPTTAPIKTTSTLFRTQAIISSESGIKINQTFDSTTLPDVISTKSDLNDTFLPTEETASLSKLEIIGISLCVIVFIFLVLILSIVIYRLRKNQFKNQQTTNPPQASNVSTFSQLGCNPNSNAIYSSPNIIDPSDVYDDIGYVSSFTTRQTNVTVRNSINSKNSHSERVVMSQIHLEDFSQDEEIICPYAISAPRRENNLRGKCSVQ